MHQHGNHHRLRHGVAAMLTDVCVHLLAVLRVVGLLDSLAFRQFRGERAAFLAGTELLKLASAFPSHNFMAVDATVRRELQRLQSVLQRMDFGQGNTAIFLQFCMALRTLEIIVLFYPLLENEPIHPTQPRSHPSGDFGARIVERFLID